VSAFNCRKAYVPTAHIPVTKPLFVQSDENTSLG
jgi:hypothetical protein